MQKTGSKCDVENSSTWKAVRVVNVAFVLLGGNFYTDR